MGVGFFGPPSFFSSPYVPDMADLDFLKDPSRDLYRFSSRFETEGNTRVRACIKSFIVTLVDS